VTAFDFALGLRGRGVKERDAVEMQGSAQLGQRLGVMVEEEAVEIDIDFQRQAILDEGGGQEIQIGQEQFPLIDFGAGENTAAVIEHVDHGKQAGVVGKPRVGRGIQLPEFTDAAALPTFDRGPYPVVGLGVGEVVFNGPAANLSSIDLEVALAEHLAGREAVGSWRFAAEPFVEQRVHFGGPGRSMIATRNAGNPDGLLMVRTGGQIVCVKLVETSSRKAQAPGGSLHLEFLGSERSQHMAN